MRTWARQVPPRAAAGPDASGPADPIEPPGQVGVGARPERPGGPVHLADVLRRADDPARRTALADRVAVLRAVLQPAATCDGGQVHRAGGDGEDLQSRLEEEAGLDLEAALDLAVAAGDPEVIWLALAVLTARLPDVDAVLRATRAARLDGAGAALCAALADLDALGSDGWVPVEVVTGRVVVDINHTARTTLSTGIQRVARETVRRWNDQHDVILAGWTDDYTALRALTAAQAERALAGPGAREAAEDADVAWAEAPRHAGGVIVPWRCVVIVPELPAEPGRASRLQAMARFSGSTTGVIGFDCVPIMAAETSAEGMSGAFASFLGAAAHVDRVATISETAAVEYRGWRQMLGGTGLSGPQIKAISLPVEGRRPSARVMRETRSLLAFGALRIVLSVGSHEPRKNHLAVLQAAEVLWREGHRFALTFVGGNSWNSERFSQRIQSLRESNRPVQTVRALPDEMLWAAYRVAYCTVFPSLHEGFGLPVAESLASGTPVITSDFGSMREIAGHGGALLVDPRNDDELAGALRRLLVDEGLHDRLALEASNMPLRTWDDYAADTWRYLVASAPPSGPVPTDTSAPATT